MVIEYPVGRLDNIKYASIITRFHGKWVYAFHKRRDSYEHPGGHVEPGETVIEAARRELYEETGITDARIYPLWDYEYIWENGKGRNNGRVFFAEANKLGELPPCSEMDHVALFDDVPDNFTYDIEAERREHEIVLKMLPVVMGTDN